MLTGDVWSAHLPYVDTLLHMDRTIKIVALERNRSKVVTSFERHTNHSTATLSTNHWQKWQEGSPYVSSLLPPPFPAMWLRIRIQVRDELTLPFNTDSVAR